MKLEKKLIALLLALAMVFSMVLPASGAGALPFSDIEGHWAERWIAEAHEQKLVSGYHDGTYKPDDTLTRAEMVQILYNLEGRPACDAESTFTDLTDRWYIPAISWAQQGGIVVGHGDGTCGPDDPVTRQEMTVILYRYAEGRPEAADLSRFVDTDKIAGWAREAIEWAVANLLIQGKGNGLLDPEGTATRAEFTKLIVAFLQSQEIPEETEPTEPEETEPTEPEETDPTEPEETEPTEPEETEPTEPEEMEPTEPEETDPTEPEETEPTEPEETEPTEPEETEPTEPEETEPTEPEETEPTEPEETEPTEPEETDPTEPEETEPTEPEETEPTEPEETEPTEPEETEPTEPEDPQPGGNVKIVLSDEGILVDGQAISTDSSDAVYAANDIIFYLEGQGSEYGEGTEADEHSQAEADAHTVIHITQPGTYEISGKLSLGQIAIDLGEEAESDPEAVVTLILNGVDITCEVAPAIIFYNVYECGDPDNAAMTVDTTAAGANIIIADGTVNNVTGSHVAKIFDPDTGKKLHKYDAAFYSKKTMNVSGGEVGDGVLNIVADNEGLDSELHLTINSGIINITAGNDCINTNEDGISVTTINGGTLTAISTGSTGEGDSIDSNGWLVINGGRVIAQGCRNDGSIDADNGVYLNGGTVIATGGMSPERLSGTYTKFNYSGTSNQTLTIKNSGGEVVDTFTSRQTFSYLIYSCADGGTYTLWNGDTQVGSSGNNRPGRP